MDEKPPIPPEDPAAAYPPQQPPYPQAAPQETVVCIQFHRYIHIPVLNIPNNVKVLYYKSHKSIRHNKLLYIITVEVEIFITFFHLFLMILLATKILSAWY